MADETLVVEKVEVTKDLIIPDGIPDEVFRKIQRELKAQPQRGLMFENDKQRNAAFIKKGLTKPGSVGYDTLRRISMSVHIVRICINVLKTKITKTPWVIKSIDPLKEIDETKKAKIEALLNKPNRNSENFRSLCDKILEDLLVLDTVSIEKTRFPDGELAELYFIDSATIRPVFDEHGNQDLEIPLNTENEGIKDLPVSFIQVLNNSQYGGPESGDIVAAWPKKDMISFHMYPQGSMEMFGYGLSPIEGVLSVVTNLLNADNYNSTYFEEGSFPPILIHFTGNVQPRDLEAYREYFIQEFTSNFHRPAITMGAQKPELLDLKADNNRDMQFMEYQRWLAGLLCAAYGLSPQDIGLTDDVNRSTSETMEDLSNQKGYGSILNLLKEVINEQIIWSDFGYEDIEFDWVAQDSTEPEKAAIIYDTELKNGTATINEVREMQGKVPFGTWADEPMFLSADGYKPLLAVPDPEEGEEADADVMNGDKPYQEEETDEIEGTELSKTISKAVLTQNNHRTWFDDRGYGQPFIYYNVLDGIGKVIKTPAAVNLTSQNLEIDITHVLYNEGLNVNPVNKMSYVQVVDMLRSNPDVLFEFEKYCTMTPEYDSEKWKSKFGGSRKFAYYLVSDYIDGYVLNNPLLLADMKRDPGSYTKAVEDIAKIWKVEKNELLGDRRADQYIITHEKRGYGFDYQFRGDKDRWERTKDAVHDTLESVPELLTIYQDAIKKRPSTAKRIIKRLVG